MAAPPPPHPPSDDDPGPGVEPPAATIDWTVVDDEGPAGEFHQRDPGPDPGHQIWIRRLPARALILGSTQPDDLVLADRAAADGIEVCRRRSGGGLVHVDPTTDCWVDAIVPASSPLWDDDVGRAFHWMGQLWAEVIDEHLGPAGPALVQRSPRRAAATGSTGGPPARALWCFGELGHGEVTVGGAKVVGLSQRRTRSWARLQSLVLGSWPGRRLLPYLDPAVAAAQVGRDQPTDQSADRDAGSEGSRYAPDPTIDPGAVRAGPPPGVRLPDPATLAEAFLRRLDGLV